MIKAILYDLDGVLVNACDWHYEALNKALKKLFDYEINRKEHLETFNGLPTRVKAKMLQEKGIIPMAFNIEELNDLKQEFTKETIYENGFVDNVKRRLHDGTKEFKKACVTNSVRVTTELMLKSTGQKKFMDLIISNEDVINPKPSPEPYIRAMAKLGIMPSECLIIEDSPKGVESANSTGANVMIVKDASEVTLDNVLNEINKHR